MDFDNLLPVVNFCFATLREFNLVCWGDDEAVLVSMNDCLYRIMFVDKLVVDIAKFFGCWFAVSSRVR